MIRSEDHPRGCGEHGMSTVTVLRIRGSSPRMRGARHLRRIDPALPGIIPADAGSTRPLRASSHSAVGSSPRMRGARNPHRCWRPSQGIIPADAGSTWAMALLAGSAGDHPRGCGEHSKVGHLIRFASGSSPRMRGALLHQGIDRPERRIIPADAGSTPAPRH